jgi:hypothetical protein
MVGVGASQATEDHHRHRNDDETDTASDLSERTSLLARLQAQLATQGRIHSDSLSMRRNNRSDTRLNETDEQQQRSHRHSIWECDTTPMTTRPHFQQIFAERTDSVTSGGGGGDSTPPPPIRRIRSRSLGSSVEARHAAEMLRGHFRPAWSPPSSPPTAQQKDAATAQTHPSEKSALLVSSSLQSPQQSPVKGAEAEEEESSSRLNASMATIQEACEARAGPTPAWICALYGVINATIVLPVLMSFASIIYRDDAFVPYMPVLVKMTVVSGIVHQLCFSTFSTLPFAVGQVQDAGLIFLSGMATTIVKYCNEQGHDDDVMLATVTVSLALATALLGLGLVLVGWFGLAQYVQLLPTWYVPLGVSGACSDSILTVSNLLQM